MNPARAWMLLLALSASWVLADAVVSPGGDRLEGVIVADTPQALTICTVESVVQIPRAQVREVTKDGDALLAPKAGQLPPWRGVMKALTSCEWATGIEQIPATVIDEGVLQSVPYRSFRFRRDYEVNIYGDLEAPACVEIGIYRDQRNRLISQLNCREFAKRLVSSDVDRKLIDALSALEDSVDHQGLTIEITPPDSPDAYEGWWISLYRKDLLDKSRASSDEMAGISAPMKVEAETPSQPAAPPTNVRSAVPNPVAAAAPRTAGAVGGTVGQSAASSAAGTPMAWTSSELSQARSSSSGRVYVRGYVRKDGTYVRPYSRRK